MNNFIENFLKMHPKMKRFIELTALVWDNCLFSESIRYAIIQSPNDASTCLMCVKFANVLCPFAFCNEFTSWAFVSIKRIKQFPLYRFKCYKCKNNLEKYQYCKECKRTICENCVKQHKKHTHQSEISVVGNFEYYGCIETTKRTNVDIELLINSAKGGVYLDSNKKTRNNIDPMIHRETNNPWDISFMPIASSPAAA
jgi:predicted nucleic acid-binding Zn ribbon protein